jgi:hypothetical protein
LLPLPSTEFKVFDDTAELHEQHAIRCMVCYVRRGCRCLVQHSIIQHSSSWCQVRERGPAQLRITSSSNTTCKQEGILDEVSHAFASAVLHVGVLHTLAADIPSTTDRTNGNAVVPPLRDELISGVARSRPPEPAHVVRAYVVQDFASVAHHDSGRSFSME